MSQVIEAKQAAHEWQTREDRLLGELRETTSQLSDAQEQLRLVRLQHDQVIPERVVDTASYSLSWLGDDAAREGARAAARV